MSKLCFGPHLENQNRQFFFYKEYSRKQETTICRKLIGKIELILRLKAHKRLRIPSTLFYLLSLISSFQLVLGVAFYHFRVMLGAKVKRRAVIQRQNI